MTDAVRAIREAGDYLYGEVLREMRARLATIRLRGTHRRFVVNRMGGTGSTWLAKLLNSHPDVFCYHEGVLMRAFPATTYGEDDVVTLIQLLARYTMHHAYLAIGDVGSVWTGHILALPKGRFTTALLVRHPARILNTRLSVLRDENPSPQINPDHVLLLRHIWGLELSRWEPTDQVFLHDLCGIAIQANAVDSADLVIPIERMNEVAYCQEALRKLTGLEYEPAHVSRMIADPVNRRSGPPKPVDEILESFSERQREWYRLVLTGVIESFGYDLERG
jgi:hypothetical protein